MDHIFITGFFYFINFILNIHIIALFWVLTFFLPRISVQYNFDSKCNGLVLAMLPILIYKLINCGQITQSA